MNSKSGKEGFTLVEILVAMVIIVTIVSMVYGSYFATSKSAQAYKARIALFQQGREVVGQMARQIRCSYSGTTDKQTYPTSIPQQGRVVPASAINYFNGDLDEPRGEILHLVTTNGSLTGKAPVDGLYEVTYRFDKSKGLLFSNQGRFVGAAKDAVQKRNWTPIAKNVKCLELEFFDGEQWLKKWNFEDKKELPCAVRIEITCENENYQQYHYGTTACVYCRKNQGKKPQSDTLVSVNSQ